MYSKATYTFEEEQQSDSNHGYTYCVQESQDNQPQKSYSIQEDEKQSEDQSEMEQLSEEEEYTEKPSRKMSHQKRESSKKAPNAKYLKERELIKKAIAQVLCQNVRISPAFVRQQLQCKGIHILLDKDRYRSCAQSVTCDIIRGIQRFLTVQCNMKMEPLKRSLVQFGMKKILYHREHFDRGISAILKTFIKYLFESKAIPVKKQVISLYRKLVEVTVQMECQKQKVRILERLRTKKRKPRIQEKSAKIKSRQISKESLQEKSLSLGKKVQILLKLTNQPKLRQKLHISRSRIRMKTINEQWTQEHQSLLIRSYQQSQNFCDIQQQFCEAFPQQKILWQSTEGLRNRFQKTMRKALNRLRFILKHEIDPKKSKLPELINMNEKSTKTFVRKIYPAQLRFKLIELLSGNQNLKLIQQLIIHINAQVRNANSLLVYH